MPPVEVRIVEDLEAVAEAAAPNCLLRRPAGVMGRWIHENVKKGCVAALPPAGHRVSRNTALSLDVSRASS